MDNTLEANDDGPWRSEDRGARDRAVPASGGVSGRTMVFLEELRRRRVGKVAIAYGAVAWGVTEASSVVLPALRVPEWAMTFIVVFLLVGFPIAMVLAWVFDATAEGIQRTDEYAPGRELRFQEGAGTARVRVKTLNGDIGICRERP